ncbi:MAG: Hpt domain-containing protein [Ancalomicrobiaceae bacterium]|nr:Hpt domain-containing protein [Ancalomicrobiaceae bacterium]
MASRRTEEAMVAKANTAVMDSDDLDDFEVGADAEVIAPKVDLRKKAKQRRPKPGDIDPIVAAESALKELTASFDVWMTDETETLMCAWKACEAAGFGEEQRETLYRSAHDIKGQAATLGFPAAGLVAASLCNLLDAVRTDQLPRELVRQHALAVRAIAQESKQNEPNPLAELLAERLAQVTKDYLASLN